MYKSNETLKGLEDSGTNQCDANVPEAKNEPDNHDLDIRITQMQTFAEAPLAIRDIRTDCSLNHPAMIVAIIKDILVVDTNISKRCQNIGRVRLERVRNLRRVRKEHCNELTQNSSNLPQIRYKWNGRGGRQGSQC